MSDPEKKTPKDGGVPLHMTSNQCGDSFVVSAVAKGLVVAVTIDPKLWPPATLAMLLEHVAGAVRANGSQPQDTEDMTWAEKPKADA